VYAGGGFSRLGAGTLLARESWCEVDDALLVGLVQDGYDLSGKTNGVYVCVCCCVGGALSRGASSPCGGLLELAMVVVEENSEIGHDRNDGVGEGRQN
jgi:hypothetical protein